ncbi:MAG: hypothetical protein QW057_00020 [Candidatus Bathyarchaeia archaeon]
MLLILLLTLYANSWALTVRAQGGFTFINSYWGSQNNPLKVYPGSSNVMLIVLVRNDLGRDLVSVTGTIYLPSGVQSYDGKGDASSVGFTQRNGTISYDVKAGEVFQLGFPLTVLKSALPGDYQAVMNLSYVFFADSYAQGSGEVTVSFTVSPYPSYSFQTDEVYWTAAGGTRLNASPGSRNLNLNIAVINLGPDAISSVDAALNLAGILSPSLATSSVINIAAGQSFTLTFTGISVPFSTGPGRYTVQLQLNTTFTGYGNAVATSSYTIPVTVTVSGMPTAGLQVVRVSWQNFDKTYTGARKVSLNVEFQNLGDSTLNDVLATVRLPSGFTDPYGNPVINQTLSPNLGYGGFAALTIGPIYVGSAIAPGVYYCQATFLSTGSKDGSQIMLSQDVSLPITVSGVSLYLDVASVEWVFSGGPAVALPGARGLDLSITLVNRGEDTLSGLGVSIQAPSGFKLIGASHATGPIPSASSFTLTFSFNISQNVTPGAYVLPLNLTFNVNPSSGNSIVSTSVLIPITVEDAERFDSALTLVNAYWGRPGNPTPVYPGSRFAPLTLEFGNNGIYAIQGAHVEIAVGNNFDAVISQVDLGATIAGGGFSSAIFYVNVDPNTRPGMHSFAVTQNYFIDVYGARLYRTRSLTFHAEVFRTPVERPYVRIYSSGWQNGYPAYPGTENATFNIVVANEAPYPIAGVSAKLTLPEGFSEGSLNGLQAYASGTIASWQTTTLSFRVNVAGGVTPGNYGGEVLIEYTLLSGGDNLRLREVSNVTVTVNSLGGFEPVYSDWQGYSPGPGNTGATLLVLVRNNEVPQLRGVYATVRLPEGFISTITGTNEVNITPTSFSSTVQVQDVISVLSGQNLAAGRAPAAQTEAALGDILALPIKTDIGNEAQLGYHNLSVGLNFVDQWGGVQKALVKLTFRLPGSTRTVDVVEGTSKLLIGSKAASIELFIRNNGTAPMKDVYVAITGVPQGISVSSSMKYLREVGPLEEHELSWLASANPQTPYVGSLPILVTISFTDMLGYRHTVNQTAIVYVEGIVEIKLMETTTSPETLYAGGPLTVSTTILNLGTYKARNVEAWLEGPVLKADGGNYTYVGDVDVGAQVPVSLTANLKDMMGNRTIYLVIRYRDVFNEPVTLIQPMNITVSEKPQPKAQTSVGLEDIYKTALVAATTLFLVGAGFMIYRMYQRTKNKTSR